MRTIGTRELKQNPSAVIKRVLEAGEEFEITAYGHGTGVKIVPGRPARARWVPGSSLGAAPAMDRKEARALIEEIEKTRDDDAVRDPWVGEQ